MKNFLFFNLISWVILCSSGFSQTVSTYASGVVHPIGIEIDSRGWIWVAQQGTGNGDSQISIVTGENHVYPFITGLPSEISWMGDIIGTEHVFFSPDGKLLILQGGKGTDSLSQSILVVDTTGFVPGTTSPFDRSAIEAVYKVGEFVLSQVDTVSNPYTLTFGPNNDMYIVDAAANAVIKRENTTGNFSLFATFPDVPNNTGIGPPFVDAVPTGIVYKNNNFFVGSLTGFPFGNNAARVYKVDGAGNVSDYLTGLTTIADVTIDPNDSLVILQHAAFKPPPPFMPNSGAVLRINGSIDTLVSGLNRPTSVRFKSKDELFVSTLNDGKILRVVTNQNIAYGDTASLGNGTINGWVKTDSSNNPVSIGLTLTEEVLSNLPTLQTSIHLNLPKDVSDTLYNHLYFGWNPAGHPPPGIYDLPHFDLHFYIISKEERLAIPGGPDPIKVEPRFVPPDYVSDPSGVPQMGTHWKDTTASEFHGQVFTETFIYGYDKGKFCFYEPMFTNAYLETHPHFTGSIKQPSEFQKAGYYPTTYKIDYDSVKHVFNFEVTDFVWHQAAAPTEIPTARLQLWLKADAGVVFNDSTVSRWKDQSGNGNDVIQSNPSRQPLLVNNELNGKPVLRFDGANDRLGFTSSKLMTKISLFIVLKTKSGSTNPFDGFVLVAGPGAFTSNPHYVLKMRGVNNTTDKVAISLTKGDPTNLIEATAPNIAVYDEWRNINVVSDSTIFNTTVRWNGKDALSVPVGSDALISVRLGDSTGSGGGLGSTDNWPNLGTARAKCDIAELIVYDTVLSNTDRLAIEQYLNDKYNIVITAINDPANGSLPERFTLNQNYPNPFNPTTTISYSIPTSEFITLKVFDVLGREVATLVNEEKPAGNYKVTLNAVNLASGVYFYRFNAGDFVSTKKLILMK